MNLVLIKQFSYLFESAYERRSYEVPQLCIPERSTVLLLGPNGSGKSTLCKFIAGVYSNESSERSIERNVEPILVWQNKELFPGTVASNLRLVSDDKRKNEQLMSDFALYSKQGTNVLHLSGGEQQKLAISRGIAAATNTRALIILDEPSQEIDTSFNRTIVTQIIRARDATDGASVLIVTHNPHLVGLLALQDPIIYSFEPVSKSDHVGGRRRRSSIHYKIMGPWNSNEFFRSPPTRFAAEFVGYENLALLRNKSFAIAMENFLPAPDVGYPISGVLCAIPSESLCVSTEPINGAVPVKLNGIEYREGGRVVARYAATLGDLQRLEVIVDIARDEKQKEEGWLSIEDPSQICYLTAKS